MSRTLRPLSARARILGAILGVACVGMAIVGSVTFYVQREQVISEVNQRIDSQISRLQTVAGADSSTDETADGSASTARDVLDVSDYSTVADYLEAATARLVPARNEGAVALIDGVPRWQPSTLSGLEISNNTELIAHAIAAAEADDYESVVSGTVLADGRYLRYIGVPVTFEGDPSQGFYIRAIDIGAELSPVTAAMITFVIAAAAVLLVTGIVGWFVIGRLFSPLRRMRETADAITIDDLSARLPTPGTDDISDLSRTVNSMLDRIEGSVDVQRQLLDDVRHELKTPITIVRGHLELMNPADRTDAAATREIGIAELDRLSRLVQDIDLLAAAGDSVTRADVDLGALTVHVGELVAVIPGHTWRIESEAQATIVGDHDRLLQAWLQLAENAAKYTPPGTPIEIGSTNDATGARLWVRDHGPGIPPAARHRIFRRFDRAGGQRASGSGLGLAIVDAIAKNHEGQCAVSDTPGGGATFTIHLPPVTAELPAPVRAGDVVLQREASG